MGDNTKTSENRRKREAKTCGYETDGSYVCTTDNLKEPPNETTVVSNSVIFENKFIDIFAGVKPDIRKVAKVVRWKFIVVIFLRKWDTKNLI